MITTVEFKCLYCGKTDTIKPSQYNSIKGAGRFCTRACHYEFYRENPSLHPLHKQFQVDVAGYQVIKVPNVKRKVRLHRYLMEQKIGRKLRSDEHVHHINHNKLDNRLENLELLTASEHHHQHWDDEFRQKMANINSVKSLARWNDWRKKHWAKNFTNCIVCGTNKVRHQGMGKCRKCYLSIYRKAA